MGESMVGKKVKYMNEVWEVVHIIEGKGEAVLNQICVDVDMGMIRVTPNSEIVKMDEITEIEHEMTAKEYAEKLKAVFGNETTYSRMSIMPCRGRECRDCPFAEDRRKKEEYNGGCIALMLYRPDLAVKMMEEWQANKDKPKRKTYLEDFREKMPNAYINPNF